MHPFLSPVRALTCLIGFVWFGLGSESVNGIAGSGDGIFYDILVNIQSFATRNQYGISSGDRPQVSAFELLAARCLRLC